MRINDRVFGVLLLILAVAYGYGASQFPVPFGGQEAVGPETFPIMLSIILGIGAVYMVIKPDEDVKWPAVSMLVELAIVSVVLALFAFALEYLGFVLSATPAVAFLCWRMGATPVKSLLTGVITAVVIYVLFTRVLELALPSGILGL